MPIWDGRVSPVFDVAKTLLVVDIKEGVETGRTTRVLDEDAPAQRVDVLCRLKIDVLICEAVSRSLETMLSANGVKVASGVCGEIGRVIKAFVEDRLNRPEHRMPGAAKLVASTGDLQPLAEPI